MAYVKRLCLWTSALLRRQGGIRALCNCSPLNAAFPWKSVLQNIVSDRYQVRPSVTRSCYSKVNTVKGDSKCSGQTLKPVTISFADVAGSKPGRYLTVTFDNGEQSQMMSLWLRQNCHCSDCVDPGTNQRKVFADRLEGSPRLESAVIMDHQVHLTWLYEDGTRHSGHIETDWLQNNCYNTSMSYTQRMNRNCPSALNNLPVVQYCDITSSMEGLWKWLENVNEYGVCLVKGAPVKLGEVAKIAELISFIQQTIFPRVWDVKAIEGNDEDVAYGTDCLPLHMDEVYYDGHPGINFLHCIRNDDIVKGGENIIVDAFPTVEDFRTKHPQHFHTLTTIPGTFQRIWKHRNEKTEIIRRRKHHIVVDRHGEIIGINWTQHNGGPIYEAEDDLEKYFDAYIELWKAFETSPYKVQNRPQPGDVLTVNNRRVLHSRTSFKLNGGVRHLQGTYVTIDGFKSKLNVLASKLGKTSQIKRMFDNCSL